MTFPARLALMLVGLCCATASPFADAQTIVPIGSGFSLPEGLAIDGNGNLFVADTSNRAIKEVIAAGGYAAVRTLGNGFNTPYSVAVDKHGNLFTSDGNSVKEVPAAGGYLSAETLGSGFSNPGGVAVDSSGNVFVADIGNNAVKEILAAGGYSTVTTIGSGFSGPMGVAVDASGNVFVADYGNGALKEIAAAGGYATVKVLATFSTSYGGPSAIAVDHSDNVFYCIAGDAVDELTAASGYATDKQVYIGRPTGVGLDSSDNLFISDLGPYVSGFYRFGVVVEATVASGYATVNTIDNIFYPVGVAVDSAGNVFVAAEGADRIDEVLAAGGYATSKTVISGFNVPSSVALDSSGNVFVADWADGNVKEILAAGGYGTVTTIADGFLEPSGVAVDRSGNLFVADTGNNAVKEVLAQGDYGAIETLGSGFASPTGLALDAAGNLFVSDGNGLSEILAAGGYGTTKAFGNPARAGNSIAIDGNGNVITSGLSEWQAAGGYTTIYPFYPGIVTGGGGGGIALDGNGNIFITGTTSLSELLPSPPSPLAAAVLPGARSVPLGSTPTIFASMINTGTAPLNNCQIILPPPTPGGTPAGLSLTYQTTDRTTNALVGTPNTPVTIPGNDGVQTFLLAFQATVEVNVPWPIVPSYQCDGVPPAATLPGIDTVDLAILSSYSSADVIALVATPTNNGILDVPERGAAAFSVASTNLGVATPITASVDTGATVLPAIVAICQTDPANAQCLSPPAASVTLDYPAGAALTFSIFVQSTGPIAFEPAQARIFVRFGEAYPAEVGSTSVAVVTQ